jgi:hypothetical protein
MTTSEALQMFGAFAGVYVFTWTLMLLVVRSMVRRETEREMEAVSKQVEERLKIATFEQWQRWKDALASEVQKGVDEKLKSIKESVGELRKFNDNK